MNDDPVNWGLLADQKIEGWGGVLDPITAKLQQRHAEAMARAEEDRKLAFEREREARLKAGEDARMGLQRDEFNAREGAAQRTEARQGDELVRQAAGIPGNLPEAQRLAQSYGRPFSQRPNPAPVMPSQEEGPVPTPDEAQQAGLIRAARDVPGDASTPQQGAAADAQETAAAQGEQQRFAGVRQAQEAYPGQRQAFEQEQANPHVTIGGVETTPADIRYAKPRADAADFDASMKPFEDKLAQARATGNPVMVAMAQRQLDAAREGSAQVARGVTPPEVAAKRVDAAGSSEDNAILNDQQNAAAMERAKLEAQAKVDAAQALATGRAPNEDLKLRKAMQPEAENLAKKLGIADIGKSIAGLQGLQSALQGATKNSAEAVRAIGQWVKSAQGQGDKTTDNDIKLFFGRIGGIEKYEDIDGATKAMIDGTMNPAVQKQILSASQEMLAQQRARVDAFLKAGDSQLGPYYGKHWQDYRKGVGSMGSQAPAAGPQGAPAGGGRPQPPASMGPPPAPGAIPQYSKSRNQWRWKLPDGSTAEAE